MRNVAWMETWSCTGAVECRPSFPGFAKQRASGRAGLALEVLLMMDPAMALEMVREMARGILARRLAPMNSDPVACRTTVARARRATMPGPPATARWTKGWARLETPLDAPQDVRTRRRWLWRSFVDVMVGAPEATLTKARGLASLPLLVRGRDRSRVPRPPRALAVAVIADLSAAVVYSNQRYS